MDLHGEPVDLMASSVSRIGSGQAHHWIGAGFSARALGALGVRDLGLALQSLQIAVEGGMG